MENWTEQDKARFNDILCRVSPEHRARVPHGYEIMYGTLMNDLAWMVNRIKGLSGGNTNEME